MAKFNRKTSTVVRGDTENLAGGRAHQESPELEFVSILLTSFVQDQFYRGASETVERVTELIQVVDPVFAAKAAVYARNEFGMRSISHVVAGELCKKVRGEEWMKFFLSAVVRRPDDITEILSYYLQTEKKLTNAMRTGLGNALSRYSSYKLAKYKGTGKAVSLVDAANILHPKGTHALKQLINGDLAPAQTWETSLSKAGKEGKSEEEVGELKGAAWAELLKEGKLGYLALLRNCRNIINQAPEQVPLLCEALKNERAIKGSLVFPFQIHTAMKMVGDRNVITALSDAVDISLSNVPRFDGDTLVVIDTSGSMSGKPIEIASIFGAALFKACNADLMRFSDDARYLNLNPRDSVTSIAQQIVEMAKAGGTNFHAIFMAATKYYDRIIILSDMQGWIGYHTPEKKYHQYILKHGKRPFLYSFDLQGYGTLQFPEDKTFCLAGFSEKVFDIMRLLESDREALINKIKAVEFVESAKAEEG